MNNASQNIHTVPNNSSSSSTTTSSGECSRCKGSGKCKTCKGAGEVYDWGPNSIISGEKYVQKCGVCDGSGRCGVCDGDGRI